MRVDCNLLHFWNEILAADESIGDPVFKKRLAVSLPDQTSLKFGSEALVRFKRTLKLPPDATNLFAVAPSTTGGAPTQPQFPPTISEIELFKVSDYQKTCSSSIANRGGVLLPLHQR